MFINRTLPFTTLFFNSTIALIFLLLVTACGVAIDVSSIDVELGDNKQIFIGDSVVINAKLDDPNENENENKKYKIHWEYISVPEGSQLTEIDNSDLELTLLPDVAGDYIIRIKLSDGDNIKAEDQITVKVLSIEQFQEKLVLITHDLGLNTEESGESTLIVFTLKTPPTSPVTFHFQSTDLTEGEVSPSSIVFSETDWDSAKLISIKGIDDNIRDGDISYFITVDSVETEDKHYAQLTIADIPMTNLDNDNVGIELLLTEGLTTSETASIDQFAVLLSSSPLAPVEVSFSSSNVNEGIISPSSIIFDESNWDSAQIITISGIDDSVKDGDIPYFIKIDSVISEDSDYHQLSVADISVVNMDNDSAELVLLSNESLTTSETGETDGFAIRLSSQPLANVEISVSSNNTSEGIVSPGSLIFNQNNWDSLQIINLTGQDDEEQDGNTAYNITVAVSASDDAQYFSLSPVTINAVNIDNEEPLLQPIMGLEERPSNTSCLAPERPVSEAAISLTRVFSDLSFSKPVKMLQSPGNDNRWYVVQQSGSVKTFNDTDTTSTNFITIPSNILNDSPNEAGLLGMAFHPQYGESNYKAYLSYTAYVDGDGLESRISEFTSLDNGATLSLDSERILIRLKQPYNNHNGGDIAFGPDGYLYIGFGDGGSAGDPESNAQNLQNLLGAMLRIDVDNGSPYSVPADNPFADNITCADVACPEIFAWGLRNPWRFNFDSATGDLWLGDVGQGAAEEVNKIQLGGNYGWNFREGFACYNGEPCGNGSMKDPIVTYQTGTDGNAITGGFVYRGNEIPNLKGVYLYADYGYGKIWALFYDKDGKPAPDLLLDGSSYISSFAQSNTGELYVTDLGSGRIFKIIDASESTVSNFPVKLSATGCMDATDITKPGAALIPFDVNVPLWTDGAIKQRWFALPDNTTITISDDANNWVFPIGTVFIKHFYIGSELVETRTLIRHDDGDWAGYSYEWDEDGLDATLLQGGKVKNINGVDWSYPSSAQCMSCHTPASGFTIGPETLQLNRDYTYANGVTSNQLVTMNHIGLFSDSLPAEVNNMHLLPTIDDLTKSIDSRARAYLHANCAYCHQVGGIGRGPANFHYLTSTDEMDVCNIDPETGDLDVNNAKLLTPSDPEASIISLRMKSNDVNRMPPIGSGMVHTEGVALIDEWINGISECE